MARKKRTEKFDCALKMPPLYHTVPGEPFDVLHSPAYQWIANQPSIAQFVFDKAKDMLVFDPATGMWHGRDYED